MVFLFQGFSSSFFLLFLMEDLRCVTINANGIRKSPKRHAFLHWLSNLRLHFACLQETRILSCAEATSWFASSGSRQSLRLEPTIPAAQFCYTDPIFIWLIPGQTGRDDLYRGNSLRTRLHLGLRG